MRDFKLTYSDTLGFDIDIKNGYPVYVDLENQTEDQRAAVAATIVQGTIPGQPNTGVDWSKLYDREDSYVDIYNDTSKLIKEVAGGNGVSGQTYVPVFIPKRGGTIEVKVIKGSIK